MDAWKNYNYLICLFKFKSKFIFWMCFLFQFWSNNLREDQLTFPIMRVCITVSVLSGLEATLLHEAPKKKIKRSLHCYFKPKYLLNLYIHPTIDIFVGILNIVFILIWWKLLWLCCLVLKWNSFTLVCLGLNKHRGHKILNNII